jgi:hypothetical protein
MMSLGFCEGGGITTEGLELFESPEQPASTPAATITVSANPRGTRPDAPGPRKGMFIWIPSDPC